jgi:hypothetical protein
MITNGTSTSSVFGSSVPRGGLESSLILNRISAGLGLSSDSYSTARSGVDTALLALELKRHERKRNMMRYGSFRDEDAQNVEKEKSLERERQRRKSRVAQIQERLVERETNRC